MRGAGLRRLDAPLTLGENCREIAELLSNLGNLPTVSKGSACHSLAKSVTNLPRKFGVSVIPLACAAAITASAWSGSK